MKNDDIDALIALYASGHISDTDLKLLHKWSQESIYNREILNIIDGTSTYGNGIKKMCEYDKDRVYTAIINANKKRIYRNILHKIGLYTSAAAILAIVSTGIYIITKDNSVDKQPTTVIAPGQVGATLTLSTGKQIILNSNTSSIITEQDNTSIKVKNNEVVYESAKSISEPVLNTVTVDAGHEFALTLCDGTKIWLNSLSNVTFPSKFTGASREISVQGEVYLEVAPNANHPFIVNINDNIKARVVGTSFNIMAYEAEAKIETTLITGSLELTAFGSSVVLTPGKQASINKQNNQFVVKDVFVDTYSAWTKGFFVFVDEPIESICRKLSRWYNIEIYVDNNSLEGMLYTGIIKKYDTLNNVVELMKLTNDLVFTWNGNHMKVSATKN